ncbi:MULTISPECIES: tRNA dihydrouridine(20/20a) synthase DusA [Idiomarina]|nr:MULTISPECIES: tRNA dihydrouridine(20/20a) synthase DusA [Idiomarina]KXS34027.1 MAG: tRNA-dihydrouridine synthase A [Idiomarina sp. T82-3]MAF76098.1 tRNA dihydrouridine(20/20a) synthase DusA [Idiomarinaceae bacterium]MEC8926193.1 tRNA dihydrouridine(20/20a) synthase DusA [Pseudomonadota bacterium]
MSKLYPHFASVAPMLDWTDRHCRYFHRLLSPNTLLYTDMVTTGAIIYGQQDFLAYNDEEHPVALQLGGADPSAMAQCAVQAQTRGYDEVNINVGCPSDRVQNGSFGACLMAQPKLVSDCIKAMKAEVDIPVTVKTRLGIDEHDSDEFLYQFLDACVEAGTDQLTLHARKAWLNGLSPKENREIPPLQYDRVYRAKQRYAELPIAINGGIKTLAETQLHLAHVDSVMIGREAYQNPWLLTELETLYTSNPTSISRESVARQMIPYIQQHIAAGGRAWHVVRHMLGLFQGQPGGKKWRQFLSIKGPRLNDAEALIEGAIEFRTDSSLRLADIQ